MRNEGAVVPPLWHYEVRNALLIAQRRGRISEGDVREGISTIRDIHIQTDQATDLDTALELAMTHRLSFYDALYVELAARRRLPLATVDTEMLRAARREGIETLPP